MGRVLTHMKTRLLFQSSILSALLIPAAVGQIDPPGRVARLNLASGAVSILTQSAGPDWVPAQINYPLTTGDQLWTDFDGRAELHVGTAAIRLRGETSATFALLDDQAVQLQLISGGLNIRVRNLYQDEVFEVDTANVAVTIRKPGDYRIDVNGQQTKVIVWSGAAEISGDNRTIPLRARDYAVVSGYGQLSYTLMDSPAPDEFDRWAQDRDRRQQQSQSARYVSPNTIGYEDLDVYGNWSEIPNLGPVWRPRVDIGWAPYKVGHWAWIEPWGWTWIDDAPWGFAPFHYGRWAYVTGSWAWVPGPVSQRVVYSPALVAWAGGGGGGGGIRFSASAGLGLAWFALGPGEVYIPSHRASAAYVTNVNVTNTAVSRTVVNNVYNTTIINRTTVNNITYVNQNAPGAMVGMSHADMAAGRRTTAAVAPATLQAAQFTAVAPVPMTRPIIQAMPRGGNTAQVARPPAAVATPSRPVVMRNQVPAAAARPVFTSATGAPAPAPARPATSLPIQEARPVQPSGPEQGRRVPGRESETVRPAPPTIPTGRPQVQTPAPQTNAPAQPPPPTTRLPESPERVRRPIQTEIPAVTPPAARPQIQTPLPQTNAPAQPPPPSTRVPESPERVRRAIQTEIPAVNPPAARPTERVERPVERIERPAPPAERVERPQPRPERVVERPINVPPSSPPPARQDVRPEPRPEPKREEPKREEKKKDEKKKEEKQ